MPFMAWNNGLSVGVAHIDEDHRKLVDLINDLYQGVQDGQGRENLLQIVDTLVDHTREHFAREEKLFTDAGLASASAHKQEHDELVAEVLKTRADYVNSGATAPSLEMMVILKGWLFDHITGSDQNDFWCLRQMGHC